LISSSYFDENISDDEYQVIYKFLASYKNQNAIISDSFKQEFGMVPLEEKGIIFKTNEDNCKSMDFCRRIYYMGKPYVIELGLCREGHMEDNPKCLSIREFRIITNGKVHFINLNTKDETKNNILFNIISTFDERKIKSPEQAYCKRMYTNKALQEFMTNHEWEKIDEGIKLFRDSGNSTRKY